MLCIMKVPILCVFVGSIKGMYQTVLLVPCMSRYYICSQGTYIRTYSVGQRLQDNCYGFKALVEWNY